MKHPKEDLVKRGLNSPFFIVVAVFNLMLIVLAFLRMKAIDNDKGILLILFLYPVLILLNLVGALLCKILKATGYRAFVDTVILLLLLLIPVFGIAVGL